MDVLPYARSVYDNDWLKNDWYLSLKIPYRYFFSYIIGFFIDKVGIAYTIFFGRILCYLLFSAALIHLRNSLKDIIKPITFWIAMTIYILIFRDGMGAGEWMVGGLETKSLAYSFVILGTSFFLRKKYTLAAMFAGLSLSFHLLVGIYFTAALFAMLLIDWKQIKKQTVAYAALAYAISGSIGIYGVLSQLLFQTTKSNLGWDIYVNLRVPHHVKPDTFAYTYWIMLISFSLISLSVFYLAKERRMRLLATVALSGTFYSIVGILIYLLGPSHLLKYYFFRFGDAVLPIIAMYCLAYWMSKIPFEINGRKKQLKILVNGSIILLFLPFLLKQFKLAEGISHIERAAFYDVKMQNWVKEHTPKDAVIMTRPDDVFFYINYDRAMFVSWKHSPQAADDIVEWHKRLKLLNRNQKLESAKKIIPNYNKLSEEDWLKIKDLYPELQYLLISNQRRLNFEIAFKSEHLVLYKL